MWQNNYNEHNNYICFMNVIACKTPYDTVFHGLSFKKSAKHKNKHTQNLFIRSLILQCPWSVSRAPVGKT